VDSQPLDQAARRPPGQRCTRGASIGIHFKCCRVYWRIYRTADGSRFAGHCPKCGFPATVNISPGGTDASFFEL